MSTNCSLFKKTILIVHDRSAARVGRINFLMHLPPPGSTLFPYSPLLQSLEGEGGLACLLYRIWREGGGGSVFQSLWRGGEGGGWGHRLASVARGGWLAV